MKSIEDVLLFQHDIDEILAMQGKHHITIVGANGQMKGQRKFAYGPLSLSECLIFLLRVYRASGEGRLPFDEHTLDNIQINRSY